jgi:hypothetical protein
LITFICLYIRKLSLRRDVNIDMALAK